jgi:hypothetical protein
MSSPPSSKFRADAPVFTPRFSVIAALPLPLPPPPPPSAPPSYPDGLVRLTLSPTTTLTPIPPPTSIPESTISTVLEAPINILSEIPIIRKPRLPFKKSHIENQPKRLDVLLQQVHNGKQSKSISNKKSEKNDKTKSLFDDNTETNSTTPYYLYSHTKSSTPSQTKEIYRIDTLSTLVHEAAVTNNLVTLEEYSRVWSHDEYISALLSKNAQGDTPLHSSIRHGNEAAAEFLLKTGADPRAKCGSGDFKCSAIHLIVSLSIPSLLRSIINKGADINGRDCKRRTPLHYAAKLVNNNENRNRIICIEILLSAGCDTNAIDEDGFTPLLYAAAFNNIPALELLLAQGAGIVSKIEPLMRSSGSSFEVKSSVLSPIHILCENGYSDAVHAILSNVEMSFAPPTYDSKGEMSGIQYRDCIHAILASRHGKLRIDTVLHSAIRSESLTTVNIILQAAIRSSCLEFIIELRNGDGYTPLQLACCLVKNEDEIKSKLTSLTNTDAWLTTRNATSSLFDHPNPAVSTSASSPVPTSTPVSQKSSRLELIKLLTVTGGASIEISLGTSRKHLPPSPLSLSISSGDLDSAAYLLGEGASSFSTHSVESLRTFSRNETMYLGRRRMPYTGRRFLPYSLSEQVDLFAWQLRQSLSHANVNFAEEEEKIMNLGVLLDSGLGSDIQIVLIEEPEIGWQTSFSIISLFDGVLSKDTHYNIQPMGFMFHSHDKSHIISIEKTNLLSTLFLHSEILALRSSYFRTLLFGNGAEASLIRQEKGNGNGNGNIPSIEIHIPSVDAMNLVITYLYTGKIITTVRSRAISILWNSISEAIITDKTEIGSYLTNIEIRTLPETILYFEAIILANTFDIPDLVHTLESQLMLCAYGAALIELGQALVDMTLLDVGKNLISLGETQLEINKSQSWIISPIFALDFYSQSTLTEKEMDKKPLLLRYAPNPYAQIKEDPTIIDSSIVDIITDFNEMDATIALSLINSYLLDNLTITISNTASSNFAIVTSKRIAKLVHYLLPIEGIREKLKEYVNRYIQPSNSTKDTTFQTKDFSAPSDLVIVSSRFMKSMQWDFINANGKEKQEEDSTSITLRDLTPFALAIFAVKELPQIRYCGPTALWQCALQELEHPTRFKPPACFSITITSLRSIFTCYLPSPFLKRFYQTPGSELLTFDFSICSINQEQEEFLNIQIINSIEQFAKYICGDSWALFSSDKWPKIIKEELIVRDLNVNKLKHPAICLHCLHTQLSPTLSNLLLLLSISQCSISSLTSTIARQLCKYLNRIATEALQEALLLKPSLSLVTVLTTILVTISDVNSSSSEDVMDVLKNLKLSAQVALLRVLSKCVSAEIEKIEFELTVPRHILYEKEESIKETRCFLSILGHKSKISKIIKWAMSLQIR